MSTSTPPGWYPVPEPGPGGAAQERWWDGSVWTAEVRSAGPAAPAQIADAPTQAWQGPAAQPPAGYGYPQQQQQPQQPYGYPQQGYPQHQGFPQQQGLPQYAYPSALPPAKNRNGLIIGIAAGVLALAVLVGVVVVVSGGDDDPVVVSPLPSLTAPTAPRSSPAAPRTSPSPRASTPALGGGTLTDVTHGWRVPRPTAWTIHTSSGASSLYEVTGPYDCGLETQCIRGQFSIEKDSVPGTDASSLARAAMADYAPRIFGDLTGHQEVNAGPVTVAGATGYAVRWYVTPSSGAKGYVLMVAVPDPEGSGYVLMHGGVDDDSLAPKPAVLDQIVAGIRPLTAGSTA
ncbi:hypothetical protein KNE206_73490 [Kitasatospora sp. NE20-6]|uniref:DUF2510 domain-containing protein n=1 Tax=Kitasatospora sp. NE20-6 TaxID=2859066 RepID=UPI0034DBC82E